MVSLELLRGKGGGAHLPVLLRQGRASADWLLQSVAQWTQAGAGGLGAGQARPTSWGEPVPSRGKGSVSNWFCPRRFCSRKITICESDRPTVTSPKPEGARGEPWGRQGSFASPSTTELGAAARLLQPRCG